MIIIGLWFSTFLLSRLGMMIPDHWRIQIHAWLNDQKSLCFRIHFWKWWMNSERIFEQIHHGLSIYVLTLWWMSKIPSWIMLNPYSSHPAIIASRYPKPLGPHENSWSNRFHQDFQVTSIPTCRPIGIELALEFGPFGSENGVYPKIPQDFSMMDYTWLYQYTPGIFHGDLFQCAHNLRMEQHLVRPCQRTPWQRAGGSFGTLWWVADPVEQGQPVRGHRGGDWMGKQGILHRVSVVYGRYMIYLQFI